MIAYKLTIRKPLKLEFQLLKLSGDLLEYLLFKKCYITRKGVLITYNGSHMILEDSEGPIGIPVGITIPALKDAFIVNKRLVGNRNSYITNKEFKSASDLISYLVEIVRAFDELSSAIGQSSKIILINSI